MRPIMRKLLLVMLAACGGTGTDPDVTVEAATPESLAPDDDARDDLTITVSYDDGDGDLGGGIAEVHDCRADGVITELVIPAIAPDGVVGEHISGTLDLHVNDVGAVTVEAVPATCADLGIAALGATETVFCVVLVDTAGHRGGGDCTAAIALE
jgi:hypothetical protein